MNIAINTYSKELLNGVKNATNFDKEYITLSLTKKTSKMKIGEEERSCNIVSLSQNTASGTVKTEIKAFVMPYSVENGKKKKEKELPEKWQITISAKEITEILNIIGEEDLPIMLDFQETEATAIFGSPSAPQKINLPVLEAKEPVEEEAEGGSLKVKGAALKKLATESRILIQDKDKKVINLILSKDSIKYIITDGSSAALGTLTGTYEGEERNVGINPELLSGITSGMPGNAEAEVIFGKKICLSFTDSDRETKISFAASAAIGNDELYNKLIGVTEQSGKTFSIDPAEFDRANKLIMIGQETTEAPTITIKKGVNIKLNKNVIKLENAETEETEGSGSYNPQRFSSIIKCIKAEKLEIKLAGFAFIIKNGESRYILMGVHKKG